jgi:hypothetical protein
LGDRRRVDFSWWRTQSEQAELGSSTRVKQAHKSEDTMSPQIQPKDSDDMRPEYDFSQGVRGKHYKAYQAGINVVFLEPDIAAVFPDSASVNQALRLLVRLSKSKAIAGALTNTALPPTSRARRKAKPKQRSRAARG